MSSKAKAASWQRYYQANKDRESVRSIAKTKALIESVKAFLSEYLISHPCIDCGETDLIVLEFDHRDPRDKLFTMAVARRGKHRMEKVRTEVDKCDIRCANCHRRRTYAQQQRGEINNGAIPSLGSQIAPRQ